MLMLSTWDFVCSFVVSIGIFQCICDSLPEIITSQNTNFLKTTVLNTSRLLLLTYIDPNLDTLTIIRTVWQYIFASLIALKTSRTAIIIFYLKYISWSLILVIAHGLLYHMAWYVAYGFSVRHDARTSHIKYFAYKFVLPINVVC